MVHIKKILKKKKRESNLLAELCHFQMCELGPVTSPLYALVSLSENGEEQYYLTLIVLRSLNQSA